MILNILILCTLCVIGLGGFTRLMDAGLGCPDWPGCYGHWVLPDQDHGGPVLEGSLYLEAWIEMIHRYAAGTLGLCVISIAAYEIFYRKRNFRISTLLIVCIILQALLGMWTVTMKLHPMIVTGHFLGGITLLSLLTWLRASHYWSMYLPALEMPSLFKNMCAKAIILYVIQIFLGAWVSTNYAGLACPHLFSCSPAGSIIDLTALGEHTLLLWSHADPLTVYTSTDKAWIQILHRVNALFLGLELWKLRKMIWSTPRLLGSLGGIIDGALFIYSLQVLAGILLIKLSLPLYIAVIHNILAACLSIPLVFLCNYSRKHR